MGMNDDCEYGYTDLNPEITQEQSDEYDRLLKICKDNNYKSGWVYYRMSDRYGEEIAKRVCEFDDEYEEW